MRYATAVVVGVGVGVVVVVVVVASFYFVSVPRCLLRAADPFRPLR